MNRATRKSFHGVEVGKSIPGFIFILKKKKKKKKHFI